MEMANSVAITVNVYVPKIVGDNSVNIHVSSDSGAEAAEELLVVLGKLKEYDNG